MAPKTLVIHPQDRTTRFLELVYQSFDATVVTGQVDRWHLRGLMDQADQIIMLGHGSSHGLYSVGQFPPCQYVIESELVSQLRERENNIFIWCYAADFARRHRLQGFATGMFISEVDEARWFQLTVAETEIQESNHAFANVVGRYALEHSHTLYSSVDDAYGRLARVNPVAKYNHARIQLFEGSRCNNDPAAPRDNRLGVLAVVEPHDQLHELGNEK